MEFIFEAIFDLLGILIYHTFLIGLAMFSEIFAIIPIWIYILLAIIFALSLIKSIFGKKY